MEEERAQPARPGEVRPEGTGPQSDRAELAELARALSAHARRRARSARRTPAAKPAAREPAGAAPVRAVPEPAASERGRETPARAPAAPASAATERFAVARGARTGTTAASVGGRGAGPTAKPLSASSSDIRGARNVAEVRAAALAATDLEELRAGVAACQACSLCATRTQTVFQDGRGTRRVLFVGEAPGAEEDRTGVPFVGRAGQLLTDIIEKGMGLAREEVVIANVLKCRPPENRDPTPLEKETCTPWLDRQIELLDPEVILPLGRHAAMHVLQVQASMGAMRGQVHERGGRKIVPTFHPAYLLRNPAEKKECWKDIQRALAVLGLPRPPGGSRA